MDRPNWTFPEKDYAVFLGREPPITGQSCLAFSASSLSEEMTIQYNILLKQEQAHDDAIWLMAWGTNKKENSESVVTGSLSDLVMV